MTVCKRCLRLIVPFETAWVLEKPGERETNIHKCQGVLTEHEPFVEPINSKQTNEKENLKEENL